MRLRRKVFGGLAAASLVAASMVAVAIGIPALTMPATAASLAEVTDFGSNPGNLRMYVYVPDTVAAKPAIVMALHPCGGSGPGFYQSSEFAALADRYGFIVIYPSASNKKYNCFDNWSDASKVRGVPPTRCHSSRWSRTPNSTTTVTRPGSTPPGARPAR